MLRLSLLLRLSRSRCRSVALLVVVLEISLCACFGTFAWPRLSSASRLFLTSSCRFGFFCFFCGRQISQFGCQQSAVSRFSLLWLSRLRGGRFRDPLAVNFFVVGSSRALVEHLSGCGSCSAHHNVVHSTPRDCGGFRFVTWVATCLLQIDLLTRECCDKVESLRK